MGKFLATVFAIIIATLAFIILWFLIPLISAITSSSPSATSFVICGLILLCSLFSLGIFKSRYAKWLPIATALILGLSTCITTMRRFHNTSSYEKEVLIDPGTVYDKFGNILLNYNGSASLQTDRYGEPIIVISNSIILGDINPARYSIYSLDGACIARDIYNLNDYI